jgi:hypothetical protein
MEQNTIDAGVDNFNLPHDVIQLPSGGIFYKSKKKSIKVGYLTATDENFLMSSGQGSNDNIVMSLLRSKVYEHDLRPEELIDGDVEAILIFLRNSSFGPEYNITLTDPKTGKPFSHTEVLDELNIKQTAVKPDENGLFTTTLPRTGVTVKLRPLTYSDTIELSDIVDKYPVGRPAPIITLRLMRQIVEVEGNDDKGYISTFISTLPIMDSKYIRTFIKDNQPSLDLIRIAKAPSGELVSFEIAFGVEFFRVFF